MTCIVGFTDKKNNVTWIGADSLGSNGYTQDVESNPKVFRNTTLKNVVMGSTSTFRHIDLLKYSKTLFPEIDKYKIPSGKNNEVTAKGSLYATIKYMKDFTPEQHILTALEAAEKNCCGVQRPFVILNTKNEDIIIVGLDGKREVIKKD